MQVNYSKDIFTGENWCTMRSKIDTNHDSEHFFCKINISFIALLGVNYYQYDY